MYLKTLTLKQFKNHRDTKFRFDKQVNCFVGDNGAGKTNVLDAIHYLCLTKSYFNYIDAQNIQFDCEYFVLKGQFDSNDETIEIQCNMQKGEGKVLKRNQKRYKRFSDHIGSFPLIIISPTDTNLIIEGADVRRKYLDSSIAQYNKMYLTNLIDYNRVLKQRNALLKQFAERNTFDSISLDSYDTQLIALGKQIHQDRKSFLAKLTVVFNTYYKQIADSKEQVQLTYKSQLNEGECKKQMNESLHLDKISCRTQVGVHKDDIEFEMNGHPIKKIGSQGQQKSFLIALKLAQFDFMKQQMGVKPILLLDDIFDKLDDSRVAQLISFVNKRVFGQVFITDTHAQRIQAILSTVQVPFNLYTIEEGTLI